jgi:signal transduction histidine kinase
VQINQWGRGGYLEVWTTRLLSNVTASLIIVPAIVTAATGGFASLRWNGERLIEAAILVVALLSVTILVFDSELAAGATPALIYLPLPLLLWAALRFGPTGAAASFAMVAFLTIWGARRGIGAFGAQSSIENAHSVQLFLIFLSPMLLCLAAAMEERRRGEEALRTSDKRFRLALAATTTQRLARASRLTAMGELTASIAHEINQPMSAILYNVDAAEMLLDSGNERSGELREILQDIRKDNLRANEIIKHIRALVNKHERHLERFDVDPVIAEVLKLVSSNARQRGIAFESCVGQSGAIRGDRIHVEQVLLNLILNAMDAVAGLADNRRVVKISSFRSGTDVVEIRITDRGPGIPAEHFDSIFDSFFSTKRDGMGLGLSIARSLVEADGGTLTAANNTDVGACFCVRLPVEARSSGKAFDMTNVS